VLVCDWFSGSLLSAAVRGQRDTEHHQYRLLDGEHTDLLQRSSVLREWIGAGLDGDDVPIKRLVEPNTHRL